ncbi:hypothetical protein [Halomonas koreensis]|uniref:Toxin CptA n=1 Tax=Halomonas koreensis TaxID=245385 RepID=A0ABU1G0X7_9GAMM|nr:hypothetical protein [Halomonas koreensis]MDR5866089.1 hypothetical protein [Halomonas koreensis]
MPRTPTTITIVPSRLSLLAHASAALAVIAWLGVHQPGWFTAVAAAVLGGVLVRVARRRPAGLLRLTPRARAGPLWAWRDARGGGWQETPLRCDYLGPWLIGLRLGARRLWLWPDSGDPEALRRLRQALVTGA